MQVSNYPTKHLSIAGCQVLFDLGKGDEFRKQKSDNNDNDNDNNDSMNDINNNINDEQVYNIFKKTKKIFKSVKKIKASCFPFLKSKAISKLDQYDIIAVVLSCYKKC